MRNPYSQALSGKIVIDFDAKTKRAVQGVVFRHWAGTPPLGGPGRRPRSPGGAAQAPWDRPPRHPCARSKHKNHRIIES